MFRQLLLAAMLLVLAGCGSQPNWEPREKQELFAPTAMRIHPVFTQLADWNNDKQPDGIEVLIEFQDRFGDPTKASGTVVFEVYQYRPGWPDPRGARAIEPYIVAIDTAAAQRDHWNRTSRGYSFQLAFPNINARVPYVLTANFELTGGGTRFSDRLVLEPPPVAAEQPATSPANQPGVRTPKP